MNLWHNAVPNGLFELVVQRVEAEEERKRLLSLLKVDQFGRDPMPFTADSLW